MGGHEGCSLEPDLFTGRETVLGRRFTSSPRNWCRAVRLAIVESPVVQLSVSEHVHRQLDRTILDVRSTVP